jgi:DinB superfamily
VAQCLDHLNSAAREYLPMMDEGIADAIRRGLYAAGPYAYNWIGRTMVWIFQPTTRIRSRTPKAFLPPSSRPRHDIVAAFRAYQVQYIDRLRQANGLDLARARVASPVTRWIRMPLGSAFAMTIAHERRHLEQARRVIQKCPL